MFGCGLPVAAVNFPCLGTVVLLDNVAAHYVNVTGRVCYLT
jgi:hypothetical protein